jgi:propionyl-CoA carboxylase alpha chain
MREALNAFVIRGISSNIPFQAALLAHPKFVAGDFNTGFIAEQYPKGFTRASVRHDDPAFLYALAVALNRRVLERSAGISGSCAGTRCASGPISSSCRPMPSGIVRTRRRA